MSVLYVLKHRSPFNFVSLINFRMNCDPLLHTSRLNQCKSSIVQHLKWSSCYHLWLHLSMIVAFTLGFVKSLLLLFSRTKVWIYSAQELPTGYSGQYESVSMIAHECIGQVLECSTWTCSGNGNETILARGVCDGKFDCEDKSDEEKNLCTGEPGLVSSHSMV